MRRLVLVSALSLSLLAGAAEAAASRAADRPVSTYTSLIGAQTVGSSKTKLSDGAAQAVAYTARRYGTVSALRVYLAAPSHVRRLIVGLYSTKSGRPGRRLTIGSLSAPKDGSWAAVKVRPVKVRAGQTYWLSYVGRGGPLYVGSARTQMRQSMESRPNLKSLPASWTAGRRITGSQMAVDGMGAPAPSAGVASVPVSGSGTPVVSDPTTGRGSTTPASTQLPVVTVPVPLPIPGAPPPPAAPASSTGCFGSPGACGFPDPSYKGGNVGVSDCSALTTVTASNLASVLPRGSYYYSGRGNVLEVVGSNVTWQNLNVADWQIYSGPGQNNLTLKNDCVSFSGSGNAQQYIINEAAGDTGLTIEDSTVFSTNATTESANGLAGGANTLLDNDYIYNTTDSISMGSNSTLENSYVISNANAGGAHTEPLYMEDVTGVTINHDTLLNPVDQTAEIFVASTNSACDNQMTVTDNLLAGGGYVIYDCSGGKTAGTSKLNFSNNDLARCRGKSTHDASAGGSYCGGQGTPESTGGTGVGAGADTDGYWPSGGFFGIDSDTFCPSAGGVTWTGNHWDDSGANVACT